jgi:hypothetical protein
MAEYMFDADHDQIIHPDEVPAAAGVAELVSLRGLLTAKEFPYKKGDFNIGDRERWSRDDCLDVGRLVVQVVECDGEPRPITTKHLGRLAVLGQAPDLNKINEYFKTFSNYKREVGSPIRYDRVFYADWWITDFVNYAKETLDELGHVPKATDYKQKFYQGKGPSFDLIRDRVGGVHELHDYLGYPNTRHWERDNFVDWGVKVMTANPGKEFSLNLVNALAADRRGPTAGNIYKKCDNWSLFREEVEHEFQIRPEALRQERAIKLSNYQAMAKRGIIPPDVLGLPDDEVLASGARYTVIQDCAPNLSADRKRTLCITSPNRFIGDLRSSRPDLTAGYIEMVADSQAVFEDIWPMPESVEHFFASQAKIDEIRLAVNRKRYLYYRAQRAAKLAA